MQIHNQTELQDKGTLSFFNYRWRTTHLFIYIIAIQIYFVCGLQNSRIRVFKNDNNACVYVYTCAYDSGHFYFDRRISQGPGIRRNQLQSGQFWFIRMPCEHGYTTPDWSGLCYQIIRIALPDNESSLDMQHLNSNYDVLCNT